jgi:hypothetical protein
MAKGDAPWKRQRKEQSTPHRDGMHAPPRQIVVRDDGNDEENGDAEERLRPDCIQYPYAASAGGSSAIVASSMSRLCVSARRR